MGRDSDGELDSTEFQEQFNSPFSEDRQMHLPQGEALMERHMCADCGNTFSDIAGVNMLASANTDNEMMILQSRSLMESVVMKLNSYITYYRDSRFRWLWQFCIRLQQSFKSSFSMF